MFVARFNVAVIFVDFYAYRVFSSSSSSSPSSAGAGHSAHRRVASRSREYQDQVSDRAYTPPG